MRALIASLVLLATIALIGCNPQEHTATTEEPTAKPGTAAPAPGAPGATASTAPTANATTGSSDSVQIHSMGAGAATPVTGTENLMGSGGGATNQVAKDKAKQVAAGAASSSSLDQMNGEGN